MEKMYNAFFREIYHKFVCILVDDMKPLSEAIAVMEGANAFIGYGFQENRAGMRFYIVASARYENGRVTPGPPVQEEWCRVKYKDVEEFDFLTEEELGIDLSGFQDVKTKVAELLEPPEEVRNELLDMELLDMSRNLEFPEFVSLTLYNGRFSPEMAWVRPVRVGAEGEFYGFLASEPRQKFGLTTRDEIMFKAYDNGKGGVQLMWDGRADEEF